MTDSNNSRSRLVQEQRKWPVGRQAALRVRLGETNILILFSYTHGNGSTDWTGVRVYQFALISSVVCGHRAKHNPIFCPNSTFMNSCEQCHVNWPRIVTCLFWLLSVCELH